MMLALDQLDQDGLKQLRDTIMTTDDFNDGLTFGDLRLSDDRRRCRRTPVCLPVRFKGADRSASSTASIGDLSKRGIFVRTLEPMLIGETVVGGFMVHAPGQSFRVRFRGSVRWIGEQFPPGPGVGVAFDKVEVTLVPNVAHQLSNPWLFNARPDVESSLLESVARG
jgi:Tfp pilus assembly protein PilZ